MQIVDAGYKIAVIEQMETVQEKNSQTGSKTIQRSVNEVLTPGSSTTF